MRRSLTLATLAAAAVTLASFAPSASPSATSRSSASAPSAPSAPSASAAPGASGDHVRPAPEAETVPTVTGPEGWQVAASDGPVVGTAGTTWTYTVEVEPATGVAIDEVVAVVDAALLDTQRGWTASGERRLKRVADPVAADIRVVLATGAVVDARCAEAGIETNGAYSCWDGQRAMLTLRRWVDGAATIPDLDTYRTYLVNHEVGHGLGFGHVDCPGPGRVAPVMMQQTKTTDGCLANGWPTP